MRKRKYLVWLLITLLIILSLDSIIFMLTEDEYKRNTSKAASIKERYESVLENRVSILEFYNYQIILEKQYYSYLTGDACCVLSIKDTTGKKIDSNVYLDNHDKELVMNVENDHITTTITASVYGIGNVSMECEYVDGIAMVYIAASMLPEDDGMAIAFKDETKRMSNPEDAEIHYLFLPTTSIDKYALKDDMCVYVSSSSILFSGDISVDQLSIVLNDASSLSIVEDGKIMDDCGVLQSDSLLKYSFKDIISNEDIEYIEVNGRRYNLGTGYEFGKYVDGNSITYESNGLKETFASEINEENETVKIRYTASWTTDPTNRNVDWIHFEWDDMYYIEGSECKVIHKVYEKSNESGDKSWITNECEQADDSVNLYGKYMSPIKTNFQVETDTYDIGTGGMCIFVSLYDDNQTYTYTEESIEVEIQLALSDYKQTNYATCVAYHHNEKESSTDITVGGSSAGFGDDENVFVGKILSYKLKY